MARSAAVEHSTLGGGRGFMVLGHVLCHAGWWKAIISSPAACLPTPGNNNTASPPSLPPSLLPSLLPALPPTTPAEPCSE